MGDQFAVNGLARKRGEILGRIEVLQGQLREAMADLDSLDRTIRLFDPDYPIDEIRPKLPRPDDWASRGESARPVLDILRQSETPLTSEAIAREIMVQREMDPDDKKSRQVMIKRIGECLRIWEKRGVIASQPHKGRAKLWWLVAQ